MREIDALHEGFIDSAGKTECRIAVLKKTNEWHSSSGSCLYGRPSETFDRREHTPLPGLQDSPEAGQSPGAPSLSPRIFVETARRLADPLTR